MATCRRGHEKTGKACTECRRIADKIRRDATPKLVDCEVCGGIMSDRAPCGNEKNHAELVKWRAKAEQLRRDSKLYEPNAVATIPMKIK